MLLRRLILVLMLVLSQLGSSVHALEHFKESTDEHHLLSQTCLVCLAVHDVETGLTSTQQPLVLAPLDHALVSEAPLLSALSSPPTPRQQSPPNS